jgi:tetratricopeptide (TPR) repeat protein
MAEYFDLGSHGRPVTTASAEAQKWFDRGLTWAYAFNHEEAVRCFERAIEHDPRCAMAHWGNAYAIGPNYNKAWDAFDPVDLATSLEAGHAAVQRALGCLDGASARGPVQRRVRHRCRGLAATLPVRRTV